MNHERGGRTCDIIRTHEPLHLCYTIVENFNVVITLCFSTLLYGCTAGWGSKSQSLGRSDFLVLKLFLILRYKALLIFLMF